GERGRMAFEPRIEDAAIAQLGGIARRNDEDAVDRTESAIELAAAEVVVLQVAQPARQDLARRRRHEHAFVERRLRAEPGAKPLPPPAARDRLAVKRVDDPLARADPADQEVAGKADTDDRKPDSRADLGIYEAQADRDA